VCFVVFFHLGPLYSIHSFFSVLFLLSVLVQLIGQKNMSKMTCCFNVYSLTDLLHLSDIRLLCNCKGHYTSARQSCVSCCHFCRCVLS